MKRHVRLLAALLLSCLLAGCAFGDPLAERMPALGTPQPVDPAPEPAGEGWFIVDMYYRYLDEPMLAAEPRACADDQLATIISAWMEGPQESQGLTPLLPSGVRLISAELRGSLAIITLSGEFYSVMPYVPGAWRSDASWVERVNVQHRLRVQALVNTVIESGLCSSVQLMIHNAATGQPDRPLLATLSILSDTDDPNETLGEQYRNTQNVLTPARTLSLILDAGGKRNAAALYPYLALRDSRGEKRPPQEEIATLLQAVDTLTAIVDPSTTVTSAQNTAATVSCSLSFVTRSGERIDDTFIPVRLIKEEGIWKIELPTLLRILRLS